MITLALSFESVCLLVQVKKHKTDFQDGGHGVNLGFPITLILTIPVFYLQVTLILHTKFQVNWPFGLRFGSSKQIFKMATIAAILDFRSERFSYF